MLLVWSRRNLNHAITLNPTLATQATSQGYAFAAVELVFLVKVHLAEVVLTLSDDDVAGSAGTESAAGMFEVNIILEAGIKDRLALVDLNGFAQGDKGDSVFGGHRLLAK